MIRLYLRRSKGEEHQAHSLETQRSGAQRFAESEGLGDWAARVEYEDSDRSRTDFEGREALTRLLAETQAGDVVLCRDQSRLGGDALEVTVVIRELVQRRRARLFYYAERHEVAYNSAIDAAMTFVRGVGSQMEVETLRSRTREALRARVRLGRVAGGRCFGYRNVRHGASTGFTTMEVDEQHAAVVRRAFEMYRDGAGLKEVAGELGSSGGRWWTKGAVRALLLNPRYRGVYVHGRVNRARKGGKRPATRANPEDVLVVEVPEWRIVDDLTWFAVAERFKERERGPRAVTAPNTRYALTGIARCAKCGGAIGAGATAKVKVSRGVVARVRAYTCLNFRERGNCDVNLAQSAEEVDAAFAAYVQTRLLIPSVIEEVVAGVRAEVIRRASQPRGDVDELERRLAELKREQRNLAQAIAAGDGITELVAAMRDRQKRAQDVALEIERARREPATEENVARVEAAVRRKLADALTSLADPEKARSVYLAMFPGGLRFTPKVVGKARGPLGARRVWSIDGLAHLGHGLIVTPPGLEPGISA